MTFKTTAMAIGTFLTTLQGCNDDVTLEDTFLTTSKGGPEHVYNLPNAPRVYQLVYIYHEGPKKTRTTFFVIDEDADDFLRVTEIKSGTQMVHNTDKNTQTFIGIDDGKIIYSESVGNQITLDQETEDAETAQRKLDQLVKETLFDIAPDNSHTITATTPSQTAQPL